MKRTPKRDDGRAKKDFLKNYPSYTLAYFLSEYHEDLEPTDFAILRTVLAVDPKATARLTTDGSIFADSVYIGTERAVFVLDLANGGVSYSVVRSRDTPNGYALASKYALDYYLTGNLPRRAFTELSSSPLFSLPSTGA